jgi:hypothetical protein
VVVGGSGPPTTIEYRQDNGEAAGTVRVDGDELGQVIAALVSRLPTEWVTSYDPDAVSPGWGVNLKIIDAVVTYAHQLRDAWLARGLD